MAQRRSLQLALTLWLAVGCAKQPAVWVPPRLDLRELGTLGLVELDAPRGYGQTATGEILEALHAAQPGVPVLELGPLPGVLGSVSHGGIGPEAARAIGERHPIDALLVGELQIDPPRPRFQVESFVAADARAEIVGTLSLRLLDARSGATLWSDRARGARSVAHLSVLAGERPHMGAVDPDGETAILVDWLVEQATSDFRGYWARP
jgi:hypothetical protein